jgi:hypothetical protein
MDSPGNGKSWAGTWLLIEVDGGCEVAWGEVTPLV